jgi:hypothetical protein
MDGVFVRWMQCMRSNVCKNGDVSICTKGKECVCKKGEACACVFI